MDAAVTHKLWLVSIVTKQSALYNVRKSVFTSTVVPRCHCCDPAGQETGLNDTTSSNWRLYGFYMNVWFACQIKSFFKPQVVCNSMTTGISYGLQWSLTHGSTVCRQMREVRVMNGKTHQPSSGHLAQWNSNLKVAWDHTPRSLGRDGKDFRYLKICSDEGNHNKVHCQLFRCTLMQTWKQQRMYSMLYAKHVSTDSARVEHLILNTSRSLCELSSLFRSLWYACMGNFLLKKYLAKSMRSSCHFKHATKGMVEQNSDLTIPKPDWLRKIRRSCPVFRLSNLQVHHTQCIWFSKYKWRFPKPWVPLEFHMSSLCRWFFSKK